MAIKTRDELMSQIKEIIGDSSDDDVLNLLTDLSDTLGDDSAITKVAELQEQISEQDKAWRKKYRDAFFSKPNENEFSDEDDDKAPRTYEDLFSTK